MTDQESFDNEVRTHLYRFFVEHGRPPVAAEIASEAGTSQSEVEAALQRLADSHVLVLAPGTPYVWMANPLSAIPTPFQVRINRRLLFGNCIWDALGIAAMLDSDADVSTWCPDCDHRLEVSVRQRKVSGDGVVHYAVPAARWWDDIGFN